MNCANHKDRPAVKVLNVPCAPEGKWPVCQECVDNPELAFKLYQENHSKEIKVFKQTNPNS